MYIHTYRAKSFHVKVPIWGPLRIFVLLFQFYNPTTAGRRPAFYKHYSPEDLEVAIEAVKARRMTFKDAGLLYGIPQRTLMRKVKNAMNVVSSFDVSVLTRVIEFNSKTQNETN